MLKALVSIHDVMPATMPDVLDLLGLCASYGIENVTLLVVPGLNWTEAQLEQLAAWNEQGHELAGHGWVHQCSRISTWVHRLHSRLLSRDVAEHLSLDKDQTLQLMSRCANWFAEQGLPTPELYVPPAWALGDVTPADLRQLSFCTVESLFGLYFPHTDSRRSLPLVGFEADTNFRKLALWLINLISLQTAQATGRTLRVAIHPQDHRLRLSSQLNQILSAPLQPMLYRDLMRERVGAT